MGRGANESLLKRQGHAQVTLNVILPIKGLSLTLHLPFSNKSIGALLAYEVKGIEHPIHYLSGSL